MKGEKTMQGRIRYDENFMGQGEYYVFEIFSDGEWSVDTAFKVENDKVSWTALMKISHWQNLGVEFHFC
jgi:hypothetical protein